MPGHTSPTTTSRRRDVILLGIAVTVAVALGAVLLIRQGHHDNAAPSTPGTQGGASSVTAPTSATAADRPSLGPLGEVARREAGDPLAQGSPTAPIVLIEFADLRCPFCAQFSRQTEPVLVERYVKKGVLRIEWRDMPIFGAQSTAAARAARAAAAQGWFWPFVQTVYAAAPSTGHPDLTAATLHDLARKAGVPDLVRFDADSTSTQFDAAIHADLEQGQSLGIPSTPAFSVNGHPVLGAQPTDVFTTLIDQLVAGKPITG
ncbi:DsbA family protein [Mycolicibacterium rhodesiae]|uniref:Disulfide bond formation protein n=1 Tax=Mycolicibacterium rhodesiae TaxID=36814 RepID=A0A1X0J534_MYCRH|nr:thioredoxin domain-containing protein [Mycolicibacterium rhodesiae]MCV7345713.1 thioredoxin domain-containing protein [Mycolicibacterium rhodesiae]ORB57091.1 disulfide bond formation protein [Mycolicibacterium rhodesiae]